ncbi:acyltransferase-domain-containing protein [Parathielavia appendiculata]|uniref:1-acyl-sn-glycerol-3-phosphate acyltransferase n=1 Tax=Parathielavia appendiculata TaxID=2587402 RepID=A0AAN6U096_9PEZI|nr:acyltransferase-domain-containing protein [Parathielavia appendiculata]
MVAVLSYVGYFVAGYTALIMFCYALSLAVPKAAFVARTLAAYIALVISSLYGVAASIVLRLVGLHQLSQWAVARCFKFLMALSTGVTFDIEDPKGHLDKIRPAVFVGNHQTELDVLMLGCMFPKYCSVTAKASLKRTPFLGWFMSLSGSIFIDRANSKDAREAMRGAADEIRNKRQSVYMFPEGTRSYAKEPMLLPFKKGAFHLAIQAQVPIVPVVVANYSHVLWIKGLEFNSGRIPCKVLDPISTKGLTAADVDHLTQFTRDLMLKELIALTEKARMQAFPSPVRYHSNGVAKATGTDMKVRA